MTNNERLKQAACTIISSNDYSEQVTAIRVIHNICSDITRISAGNIEDKDILLASGKAISPTKAAHCLLEFERTSKFVKGIYNAILELKQRFKNVPLNILYAGTGPYSALILPLTTLFKPDELNLFLLEINKDSLDAVKKLYSELDLSGFVEEFILADATSYKVPEGKIMHLMISETMQNALRKEPQVPIMRNLLPQLPAKGIFIPEEICINACLVNNKQEMESFYEGGKVPVRLVTGTIYKIGKAHPQPEARSEIRVPDQTNNYSDLMLFTEIRVFGEERLGAYNCGLNLPVRVYRTKECSGKKIDFEYIMDASPRFIHSIRE